MSNDDMISRADALAVVQYSKDPIEGIKNLASYDAVPVIRCKDCDLVQGCKNAQYLGLMGFCSHAERRVS